MRLHKHEQTARPVSPARVCDACQGRNRRRGRARSARGLTLMVRGVFAKSRKPWSNSRQSAFSFVRPLLTRRVRINPGETLTASNRERLGTSGRTSRTNRKFVKDSPSRSGSLRSDGSSVIYRFLDSRYSCIDNPGIPPEAPRSFLPEGVAYQNNHAIFICTRNSCRDAGSRPSHFDRHGSRIRNGQSPLRCAVRFVSRRDGDRCC